MYKHNILADTGAPCAKGAFCRCSGIPSFPSCWDLSGTGGSSAFLPPLSLLFHGLQCCNWEAWVRGLFRCFIEDQGWCDIPLHWLLVWTWHAQVLPLSSASTVSWSFVLHLRSLSAETEPFRCITEDHGCGAWSFCCSPPLRWGLHSQAPQIWGIKPALLPSSSQMVVIF